MKIYTMTRDYPEAEGQPVKLHVPECDVDVLKTRGWKIEEEKKTVGKTVIEETKEEAVEESVTEESKSETSFRGRKRNH